MQGQESKLAAHRLYPNNQREAISAPSSSEVHKRKLITLPSSLCKPSLRAYFNWDDNGNDDYAKRPALLDLFAGGGGAAMGYYLAGFRVVGIDIANQPHYPFKFIQADAMTFLLEGYDVIHASPPCQAYSAMQHIHHNCEKHPKLIIPIRERLTKTRKPFIIENVIGSQLKNPLLLCGTGFGLKIPKHRLFETNFPIFNLMPPCNHLGVYDPYHGGEEARGEKEKLASAIGIDWFMTRPEVREAIPPAYTEWIGRKLLRVIKKEDVQNGN